MRDPSSTYIFATRPGSFIASSERTGEMSSPVATIVPPDSEEAMDCVAPAGALDVVAAAATFCTSSGSAGAACVEVADAATSFFAQPNGSARVKIVIVMMDEPFIDEPLIDEPLIA